MKKLIFILTLFASCLLIKAGDVTLPADYNSIFAATATNENGISLERSWGVGQWFNGSSAGSTISPSIQTSSLGFANYIDNYLSKEIVLNATGLGTFRRSAFLLFSDPVSTPESYYASVLINVSEAPESGVEILAFDKTAASSSRARVFIKSGTTGFQLAIAAWGLGSISEYTTTEYSYNTTHLLVIKYTIGASTEDASLFVNPIIDEVEPDATVVANQSASSGGVVKCFDVFRQRGFASKVAGIRIGKSWTDVIKSGGKLSAPILVAAEDITSSGFTAKWTPVAAAVGYDVYVYQEGVQVGSAQNVPGQTASNLAIIGLSGNTTYTYKVVAKGDGTSSLDSDFSEASPEVSTAVTGVSDHIPTSNYITVIGKSLITDNKGIFEVYNLQGARIFIAKETNKVNTNLPAGLYVVSFTNTTGEQIIQKITIL